jgi:hypothetical protein
MRHIYFLCLCVVCECVMQRSFGVAGWVYSFIMFAWCAVHNLVRAFSSTS